MNETFTSWTLRSVLLADKTIIGNLTLENLRKISFLSFFKKSEHVTGPFQHCLTETRKLAIAIK